MSSSFTQKFSKILCVAFAYAALAELGLLFAIPPGHATPFWPPSGIALASLFNWGLGFWPGVLLGSFLVNAAQFLKTPHGLTTLQILGASFAIGIGSTLQTWIGAKLARNFLKGRDPFGKVFNFLKFLFQAILPCCLLGATFGTTALVSVGILGWKGFLANWGTWYLGDLSGIVVFAPLLLLFSQGPLKKTELRGGRIEALILLVFTIGLTWFLFGRAGLTFLKKAPTSYLLLPAILWASLRYGRYGAALSSLVILIVAVLGRSQTLWAEPLSTDFQNEFLLWLQGFSIVNGSMALTLTSSLSERGAVNLELERLLQEKSEHLKSAQSRLEEVVSGLPIVLFSLDRDGIFTLSEGRGLMHLGHKPGEVVGKSAYDVYRNDPAVLEGLRRALTGEEFVNITELESLEQFWETTWRPIRDTGGELLGTAGISIEVTEIIKTLRLREEFLLVASHELRTPVTVLKMQIDLLNRLSRPNQAPAIPAADFARIIKGSDKQVERLENLVNDLLDVSRLSHEEISLSPEKMDLTQAVREVATKLASSFVSAKCEPRLHLGAPAPGLWDKRRVEQVITHLLTNALKFGHGKPIEISVEPGNSATIFSVRDHGIGIAPKDQGRIFDRFERAVTSRSFGGMGVGLYIADQIVKGHGGSIEVQSELDKGTLFRVTLPNTPQLNPHPSSPIPIVSLKI